MDTQGYITGDKSSDMERVMPKVFSQVSKKEVDRQTDRIK